jgi:hypothetical protein
MAILKETEAWSFCEGTISLKLLALIDVFSGLVDTLAGTGKRTQHPIKSTEDLMNQKTTDIAFTINTSDGWDFAFEGGAHILFRHTTPDQRFVPFLAVSY